jgi:hypothetical protein
VKTRRKGSWRSTAETAATSAIPATLSKRRRPNGRDHHASPEHLHEAAAVKGEAESDGFEEIVVVNFPKIADGTW